MKIIKAKNYNEMSKKAFEILSSEIKKNPNSKIGFATGNTPIGLYKRLAKSRLDFSKIKAFNLDEYYQVRKSKTFSQYLYKNLFNHINLKNITLLNSQTKNPERECKNFENKIKNPDIIILGLGSNGHIAFNEPGSDLNSKTRLVKLTKETIRANSNFFFKPSKAMTIGIKTIMSSKKIILLVSGNKKNAFEKFLEDNPNFPVTFLKKHKNLTIVIDEEIFRQKIKNPENLYLKKVKNEGYN